MLSLRFFNILSTIVHTAQIEIRESVKWSLKKVIFQVLKNLENHSSSGPKRGRGVQKCLESKPRRHKKTNLVVV